MFFNCKCTSLSKFQCLSLSQCWITWSKAVFSILTSLLLRMLRTVVTNVTITNHWQTDWPRPASSSVTSKFIEIDNPDVTSVLVSQDIILSKLRITFQEYDHNLDYCIAHLTVTVGTSRNSGYLRYLVIHRSSIIQHVYHLCIRYYALLLL